MPADVAPLECLRNQVVVYISAEQLHGNQLFWLEVQKNTDKTLPRVHLFDERNTSTFFILLVLLHLSEEGIMCDKQVEKA